MFKYKFGNAFHTTLAASHKCINTSAELQAWLCHLKRCLWRTSVTCTKQRFGVKLAAETISRFSHTARQHLEETLTTKASPGE